MRLLPALFYLFAFITTLHALALPAAFSSIAEAGKELYKRKGGGGGGGKGGGSSSSSSSSSSSGSSGGGRSGSSSSLSSSSSNTGGRTVSGSGARPAYGNSYAGGAAVPYRAGSSSRGGIAPYLVGGAAFGILPGLWLYGAYAYPYGHAYPYHNDTSNRNETRNVTCVCGEYSTCGCDNNTDYSYLTAVANNQTISAVTDVNGTETLVVNGTLPNGTTASGGTESADSAAGSLKQQMLEMSGWWMVVAGVTYTLWFM